MNNPFHVDLSQLVCIRGEVCCGYMREILEQARKVGYGSVRDEKFVVAVEQPSRSSDGAMGQRTETTVAPPPTRSASFKTRTMELPFQANKSDVTPTSRANIDKNSENRPRQIMTLYLVVRKVDGVGVAYGGGEGSAQITPSVPNDCDIICA